MSVGGTAAAGPLSPGAWGAPAVPDSLSTQAVHRAGATVWSWIYARMQEPNTITGVLIALLAMIILLQHPIARAIGTESPPAALSGSGNDSAITAAPVAPATVATIGHTWAKLPDVPERDPFQPLVGAQGALQSPIAIGPAPKHAATHSGSSTSTSTSTSESTSTSTGSHSGSSASGHQSSSTGAAGGNCAASHVVHSGESLWSISERDLSNHHYSSVGAAVQAVYAANRQTIGPDPSYLVPGERLCLPSK